MIASIPIKISVRSVYSKYAVSPVSDINFGAMLINTKKTRVFTIENKGEFDFRYSVLKMINTVSQGRQRLGPPAKRTKSRDGSSSGRSQQDKPAKPKRAESVRGYDKWLFLIHLFSLVRTASGSSLLFNPRYLFCRRFLISKNINKIKLGLLASPLKQH